MGKRLSVTVRRGEQSWTCGLRANTDGGEAATAVMAWAEALSAEWPDTDQRWLFMQLGVGACAVNSDGRPATHMVITMPDPDALPPWRPRG